MLSAPDLFRLASLRFVTNALFQSPQNNSGFGIQNIGYLLEVLHQFERAEYSQEDINIVCAASASLGGARPKASIIDKRSELYIAMFPKESDTYSVA